MDLRSLIKNASVAFLAQGVAMCVSLLTTLLVPKVLGVEQYSYWQLFIFYSSYVGFCHLGLNDGIYLVNGGRTRDAIDKRSVNSQLLVGLVFQAVLAVAVLTGIATSNLGPERSFVIGCTALYMVIKNTALYLGYVFQAMNETRLYSVSCILERLCFLAPLLLLLAIGVKSFEGYVTAYLISTLVQLLFCLWYARDFLRAGMDSPSKSIRYSFMSVRVGIKLMLANIASQLVLGIARFAIDATWGVETFGKLSLSLSMVNFFLAFVSQASMVLFPALRQGTEREQRSFYRAARDGMSLLFPLAYLAYFPLRWFLLAWLPEYGDSVIFFIYLLPICVFDSRMNISCTTLFKVRREEGILFAINVLIMSMTAIGTFAGVYLFHSVHAVIVATTIVIVFRSIISEHLLSRELGVDSALALTVGELLITVVFIFVANYFVVEAAAMMVFAVAYALFLALNRKRFVSILNRVRGIFS